MDLVEKKIADILEQSRLNIFPDNSTALQHIIQAENDKAVKAIMEVVKSAYDDTK